MQVSSASFSILASHLNLKENVPYMYQPKTHYGLKQYAPMIMLHTPFSIASWLSWSRSKLLPMPRSRLLYSSFPSFHPSNLTSSISNLKFCLNNNMCRFLEETNCVGMCINICKMPSQSFIKDSLGMPVNMVPSKYIFLND